MGKTYRNVKGAYRENGERNYERRVKQPKSITPEWAMKVTRKRIEYALEDLVKQELILPCEKEDHFWAITERVVKAIDKYDPERKNSDGRTASAMNYLITTVDNAVLNIIEAAKLAAEEMPTVPISSLPPEEAKEQGYISEDDVSFSDYCKNVKALELKMDVNTLVGMLTVEELNILKLRFAGFKDVEISRVLGISRFAIVRRVMPKIQAKARKCGFLSREDIRKGL